MTIGPGKYDALCSRVRKAAAARGCILIIIGGNKGEGFSAQCEDVELLLKLPEILEEVARQMRNDRTSMMKGAK